MSGAEDGRSRATDDDLRVAAALAVVRGQQAQTVAEVLGVPVDLVDHWATTFLEGGTRAVVAEASDRVTVVAFACDDVVAGCPALFWADDVDGILVQVTEHARDAHGMPEVPDELTAAVTAAIRRVV